MHGDNHQGKLACETTSFGWGDQLYHSSHQCSPSYRNQSIDLQSKSIDWFQYDGKYCIRNHGKLSTDIGYQRITLQELFFDNQYLWKESSDFSFFAWSHQEKVAPKTTTFWLAVACFIYQPIRLQDTLIRSYHYLYFETSFFKTKLLLGGGFFW